MNTTKKTIALAHKTWLAGVGAYDSGREKAADKFDQLFVDGSAFVNDLLDKGESVEAQIQAKLEVTEMLKDKISALRAKLGFGSENRDQQIDMLSQRVDSLIEVVAKLAQQKAAEKKAPTTANTIKKTPVSTAAKPATKATAKPAVKATATKAPAKAAVKPAAKATATKAPAKAAVKPAAKATVTKVPAKAAVKLDAKVTATKTPVKAAVKPITKATATKAPANAAAKPAAKGTAAKAPKTATKPAAKASVTASIAASEPRADDKD